MAVLRRLRTVVRPRASLPIREHLGTGAAVAPIVRHRRGNHSPEARMAALKFVGLLKRTVTTKGEYDAFQRVMHDYKSRISRAEEYVGGVDAIDAIRLDTIRRCVELFQNYPVLLAGFRPFCFRFQMELTA